MWWCHLHDRFCVLPLESFPYLSSRMLVPLFVVSTVCFVPVDLSDSRAWVLCLRYLSFLSNCRCEPYSLFCERWLVGIRVHPWWYCLWWWSLVGLPFRALFGGCAGPMGRVALSLYFIFVALLCLVAAFALSSSISCGVLMAWLDWPSCLFRFWCGVCMAAGSKILWTPC